MAGRWVQFALEHPGMLWLGWASCTGVEQQVALAADNHSPFHPWVFSCYALAVTVLSCLPVLGKAQLADSFRMSRRRARGVRVALVLLKVGHSLYCLAVAVQGQDNATLFGLFVLYCVLFLVQFTAVTLLLRMPRAFAEPHDELGNSATQQDEDFEAEQDLRCCGWSSSVGMLIAAAFVVPLLLTTFSAGEFRYVHDCSTAQRRTLASVGCQNDTLTYASIATWALAALPMAAHAFTFLYSLLVTADHTEVISDSPWHACLTGRTCGLAVDEDRILQGMHNSSSASSPIQVEVSRSGQPVVADAPGKGVLALRCSVGMGWLVTGTVVSHGPLLEEAPSFLDETTAEAPSASGVTPHTLATVLATGDMFALFGPCLLMYTANVWCGLIVLRTLGARHVELDSEEAVVAMVGLLLTVATLVFLTWLITALFSFSSRTWPLVWYWDHDTPLRASEVWLWPFLLHQAACALAAAAAADNESQVDSVNLSNAQGQSAFPSAVPASADAATDDAKPLVVVTPPSEVAPDLPPSTQPLLEEKVASDPMEEKVQLEYDIQEVLGRGGFGVVHVALRKSDGVKCAVKIIDKTKLDQRHVEVARSEVAIHKKIDHPNCVKLFDTVETNDRIYMFMELLSGGQLVERLLAQRQFSERDAANIVQDIALALKYVHEKGIVHRDLKPENLIYKDNSEHAPLKLTDFGLAKIFMDDGDASRLTLLKDPCGTAGYVSPEVLDGKLYDNKVDMWSLGVITYILLCGFPPFFEEDEEDLYERIRDVDYCFPAYYWGGISDEAKDLVSSLMKKEPSERLSAKEVLAHKWITKTANVRPLGHVRRASLAKLQILIQDNAAAKLGLPVPDRSAEQHNEEDERVDEVSDIPSASQIDDDDDEKDGD